MKALKKPTKAKNCPHRKRFEDVCKTIRKALHIDHLEREYQFHDEGTAEASMYCFANGWRLEINVYPNFWKCDHEMQLRILAHEHIHVALLPLHQSSMTIRNDWVAPHNKTQVEEIDQTAAEIAVDHMTSVVFDLIKDRFA